MKFPRTVLAALTLAACADPTAMRTPTDPAAAPAWVWAMVVNDSGVCIAGATVKVVSGQSAGLSMTQDEPCDAWGYGGGVMFTNLQPQVEMVLRASAPGFVSEDKKIYPSAGPQMAILFVPSREQP